MKIVATRKDVRLIFNNMIFTPKVEQDVMGIEKLGIKKIK
ncbi:hypothetical protein RintRC_6858 [Richelia intracellularis]|nr:hypothetical protein RintRC_6858 [Richelia intracellularis]